MADRFVSPVIADEDNPFLTEGVRRRLDGTAPEPLVDPSLPTTTDNSSGFNRRVRSAATNFASYGDAIQGLGNQLVGDQEAAQKHYQDYNAAQERAQVIGPEVQTLEDVQKRGNSPMAYAEWAATQAVNFAPDIIATVASGGVGGAVGSTIARRAGLAAVEGVAKRQAAKATIANLAEDVVAKQGADAAQRVARAELTEATAARTLRNPAVKAGLDAATETGMKAGQIAGATVGQYPGVVADSVGELQNTDQEGAWKIGGTDVISAAIGSLPAERFLSRLGGNKAIRDEITTRARDMFPRIAKEFGKQGALEGGTGVAQAVVQLAGHKWVNDNVDLLGPEAFERYLAEAVGGFVAGGSLSGAHTAGAASVDLWKAGAEGRGAKFDALKERLAKNLRAAAEGARKRAAEGRETLRKKARPGEPMDTPEGEAAADGAPSEGKSATDVFSDFYEKTKDGASTAYNAAKGAVQSAADRWRGTNDKVQMDEDIDTESTRLAQNAMREKVAQYESGETAPPLKDTMGARPTNTAPIELDNGTQRLIATLFPKDDGFWQRPEAARSMLRSVEKIFTGDQRTNRDNLNIARMQEWFPEQIASWESTGPEYADALREAQRQTRKQGADAEENAAERAAQQGEIDAAARRDPNFDDQATAVDDGDLTGDAPPPAFEGIHAADANEAGVYGDRTALDSLPGMDPSDPAYGKAQQNARDFLLGRKPAEDHYAGGGNSRIFKEGKNQEEYKAKLNSPSTIRLADSESFRAGNVMRSKLLELGNSIQFVRKQNPGLSTVEATHQLITDLTMAGVKLDLSTLQSGEIKNVDGDVVGRLTPREVTQLRGEVTTKSGKTVSLKQKTGPVPATTGKEVADAAATKRTARDTPYAATPGVAKEIGAIEKRMAEVEAEYAKRIEAAPNAERRTAIEAKRDAFRKTAATRLADARVAGLAKEKSTLRESREGTKSLPNHNTEYGRSTRIRDDRPDQREISDVDQQFEKDRKQVPRDRPPQTRIDPKKTAEEVAAIRNAKPGEAGDRAAGKRGGERVSTISTIDDVKVSAPYEHITQGAHTELRVLRRKLERLHEDKAKLDARQAEITDGAERTKEDSHLDVKLRKVEADITQTEIDTADAEQNYDQRRAEIGREIGLKEIDKELANGRLSLEKAHEQRRALKNPDNINAALNAFDKARDGGFDPKPTVVETRNDKAESEQAHQEAVGQIDDAYVAHFGKKHQFDSRKDKATNIEEVFNRTLSTEEKAVLQLLGQGELRAAKKAFSALPKEQQTAMTLRRTMIDNLDNLNEDHPYREIMDERVNETNVDAEANIAARKAAADKAKRDEASGKKEAPVEPLVGDKASLTRPTPREAKAARAPTPMTPAERKSASIASEQKKSAPNLLDAGRSTKDKAELKAVEPLPTGQAESHAAREAARTPATRVESKPLTPAERAAEKAANALKVAKLTFRERVEAEVRRHQEDILSGKTPSRDGLIGRSGLTAAQKKVYDELYAEPRTPDLVQFDEDIKSNLDSIGDGDTHDYKAETGMVNALLKSMGYTHKLTVKPMPDHFRIGPGDPGGVHAGTVGTIYINPDLKGAERIEVIAHELGHNILRAEVAKAMNDGTTAKDASHFPEDALWATLQERNPALHDALMADFDKWHAANPLSTRAAVARASRAPQHRAKATLARNTRNKNTIGDLSEAKQKYTLSRDEWFADQIARALTSKPEATDIVGQFFKTIADALRKLYDTLFAAGSSKWAPAPSVEKFVHSLFNPDVDAVKEVFGHTTSAESAAAAVEAAVANSMPPLDPEGAAARRAHAADFYARKAGKGAAAQKTDAAGKVSDINEPPAGAPPSGPPSEPPSNVVHVPDGLPPNHSPKTVEATMRFVRDVLSPKTRMTLERVLTRGPLVKQLREIYKDNPRYRQLLDSATHGLEGRIALAYIAWKDGKLNTGPEGTSALKSANDDLMALMGVAGEGDLALRTFDDIATGYINRLKEAGKTYDVHAEDHRSIGTNKQRAAFNARKKAALDAGREFTESNSRGKLNKAVQRASEIKARVTEPLSKFWDSKFSRAWAAGIPAWRQIASKIQRPGGTTGDDLGFTPIKTHTTAIYLHRASQAFEGLDDRELHKAITYLQRGPKSTTPHTGGPKVQAAVDKVNALMTELHAYAKEAGVDIGFRDGYFPVVLDLRNEKARSDLTDLYMKPEYEQRIREIFGALEGQGSETPKGSPRARRAAAAQKAAPRDLPPVKQEVLDFFASARDKLSRRPDSEHAVAMNEAIVESFKAGDVPALERHIKAAVKRRNKFDDGSATARLIDLEIRYAHARIADLNAHFSEPGSAAPAASTEVPNAEHPNAPKAPKGEKPKSTRPIEDLVKDLVDGAMHGPEGIMSSAGDGAPNFKGANYRLSSFIYELGSEADIKKFASLQSKNPAEILGRYIEPLINRAEYARRFGDDGAGAQKLLDDMAKQGATPAQVTEAKNMLKAALGTYGAEGSPTLAAISPALAAKFAGPKSKAFIQGAQAYQNARLLPLATLSSLVDPIGIAVRTGGDFKTAWDGFKLGIKSLYDKGTREDIHALLATLGSTEDFEAGLTLNSTFGGGESPLSRRSNEIVFKINGLAGWTRATRYMALEAANGFMLKHKDGANDTSVRYLDELGLKPGDVREVYDLPVSGKGDAKRRVDLLTDAERKSATKEALASDDRVRKAMMQFVDESILRPNSQQVPLWYSDPYMGLVTQYKAFAYAMFDQIGGRIARELKHGNPMVLLPALAYLPVTAMAELLREFLQYGTEGNPRRKGWGVSEYTALAVSKNVAVKGPKFEVQSDVAQDVQRRRIPGSSQIGPTAGQVRDAIGGDPGKAFESALPGSALYRKWNDDRAKPDGTDDRAVRG